MEVNATESEAGSDGAVQPRPDQDDVSISLRNLSKAYFIYDDPKDRLKQAFLGRRKKYYREFWALRDISLDIHRGETLAIIGRNGSGKSTLLQIVCGTLTPTARDILPARSTTPASTAARWTRRPLQR